MLSVTTVFDFEDELPGADDLLVAGDEIAMPTASSPSSTAAPTSALLAATSKGTLLAAGGARVEGTGPSAKAYRGVWRKPGGGAWSPLPEEAIGYRRRIRERP